MHTYSVRTWDFDKQDFAPQAGLSVPWDGLTLWELKQALRELRAMGYEADRVRFADGSHDSDPMVLVERDDTDERIAEAFREVDKALSPKQGELF